MYTQNVRCYGNDIINAQRARNARLEEEAKQREAAYAKRRYQFDSAADGLGRTFLLMAVLTACLLVWWYQ